MDTRALVAEREVDVRRELGDDHMVELHERNRQMAALFGALGRSQGICREGIKTVGKIVNPGSQNIDSSVEHLHRVNTRIARVKDAGGQSKMVSQLALKESTGTTATYRMETTPQTEMKKNALSPALENCSPGEYVGHLYTSINRSKRKMRMEDAVLRSKPVRSTKSARHL